MLAFSTKHPPRQEQERSSGKISPWAFGFCALLITGLMASAFLLHGPNTPAGALRNYLRPVKITLNVPPTLDQLADTLPFFSSIRVVSLREREDRRAHMRRLDGLLGLGFIFSDAILYTDPRVTAIVERVGNHTKADKKKAEVGHVACRMSHRRAIEAAEAAGDEFTLILEDDVDFESAFRYLAGTILRDVPKDWDLILFGHTDFSDESRHGRDPRTKNFYIYKSIEPQGGHAYAMSPKGRKLILDLLDNKRPDVYETDDGQPIDEIFMYLARLQRAQLFSVIPDLVVQRPLFKSDIFGTPAGFKDGMHAKPLLDSALARLPPQTPPSPPQPNLDGKHAKPLDSGLPRLPPQTPPPPNLQPPVKPHPVRRRWAP
ncbi:hypothetical protein CROQUDRAFT_652936 [Cronartium quercuum f. sp. fusiforme G11]|uniref:Glycosyl transferase family 25 domain-containing protein n=1 Tax=Cronartium quercuum f. sp. fusiforme G11 TaxID=708437 RepID=A0A9P6NUU1_9BASI|nr:hypothetical protein CROQUDRAFT_652936 [Cronartium quercuum f. sp. fusiforme G11]